MTREVTLDVDTQNVIDALEDTGDYKVFEENTEGLEAALEWIKEQEFTDQGYEKDHLLEDVDSAVRFIMDRLSPDTVKYVCEIYTNAVVNAVIGNAQKQLDTRCDDMIQAIIAHKGVDYVLDQCGLDNRVTRACTTDYHYVVDALKDRRSMFIAEDELGALRYVMHKITASKGNMEKLGQYIDSNCTEELIDAMLGPIYSDKIIRHVESSIEGMIIRKREDPTEEMIEVLLTYFDEFDYRIEFLKQMRRHGIMLETILRAYVDDERAEEREAHDN